LFGLLCLIPITRNFLLQVILSNVGDFGVAPERKESTKKDWIEGEFDKDK
jgi:UPF0716 family protein affecting phage T7 exclusion